MELVKYVALGLLLGAKCPQSLALEDHIKTPDNSNKVQVSGCKIYCDIRF
jgi:hypothetical protein